MEIGWRLGWGADVKNTCHGVRVWIVGLGFEETWTGQTIGLVLPEI